MENNFHPMMGGIDVDIQFGIPSQHEDPGEREAKRQEQRHLERIEAEAVLLAELEQSGGVIVKHLINSALDSIRTALYAPSTDEEIVQQIKLARAKLDAIRESLGLSSAMENATKYTVLEFVLSSMRMSLPRYLRYQAATQKATAAP